MPPRTFYHAEEPLKLKLLAFPQPRSTGRIRGVLHVSRLS